MLKNEKLNSLLYAQSIRRQVNSYNFAAGLDYNFLQPQSIRSTLNCLDKGFLPCRDKTTTLKLLVNGLNRSPKKPVTIGSCRANPSISKT
jgi:hypothetical protein